MTFIKSIDQFEANRSRHPEVDQSNIPPRGAQRAAPRGRELTNTPGEPAKERKLKTTFFAFSLLICSVSKENRNRPYFAVSGVASAPVRPPDPVDGNWLLQCFSPATAMHFLSRPLFRWGGPFVVGIVTISRMRKSRLPAG